MPAEYSDCKWYADEVAFGLPNPAESSAPHRYLELLVEWSTRQKEIVEFAIPITATNVVLELLTFVQFKDIKYTAGEFRDGYITKIKPEPRNDQIILELTLIPSDIETITDCIIEETGTATNTIDENGSQPNDINETGMC